MRKDVALGVLAGFAIAAAPVIAHHSQSIYDESQMKTLVGVVTLFDWRNPHTTIHVEVVEAGATVTWEVETNSAVSLKRSGWRRDLFKSGDKVTVKVNPAKSGKPIGHLRSIVGPDGKEFTMPGNGPDRPRTGAGY